MYNTCMHTRLFVLNEHTLICDLLHLHDILLNYAQLTLHDMHMEGNHIICLSGN